MTDFAIDPAKRAELYVQQRAASLWARLGFGMDGIVFATSRRSAVKAFERQRSYYTERDVYLRLQELDIRSVAGHAIPGLRGYDDLLGVIEMDIVQPPYILDFAKAQLDIPLELVFPEDVMAERHSHWAELFGDRWPQVIAIMNELERRCGVYLLDPTPRNIAFADD